MKLETKTKNITPSVACYTLTWNRLEYTKKSFSSMYRNAGEKFDHYIVDNGSEDNTPFWLRMTNKTKKYAGLIFNKENRGIIPATNQLHNSLCYYDVVVRTDNDVEYLTSDWLYHSVQILKAFDFKALLCPNIVGLKKPMERTGEIHKRGKYTIYGTTGVGGFWVVPKALWTEYKIEGDTKHDFKDFRKLYELAQSKHYFTGIMENVRILHDSLKQPKEQPKYEKERQKARTERVHTWI